MKEHLSEKSKRTCPLLKICNLLA